MIEHILGVVAGKGGVGKSTIAVNLALGLQRRGAKVGILDADVYGPSLRKMLPEEVLPSQSSSSADRIVPALCSGIKMISMAYFRKEEEAAIVRAPIANAVIQQFIHQVDWGDLDYLLIDFPPGTGDIQLTLMQQAALSGALIVTTPQEIALLDVSKAMQMLMQLHIPILGVAENMSYYTVGDPAQNAYLFGKGGGEKLAARYGVPLLVEIPLDPSISSCGDQGKSLFVEAPTSSAAYQFSLLAEKVVEQMNSLKTLEGSYLKTFALQWNREPSASFSAEKREGGDTHPISTPLIHTITQKDRFTFTVEWRDGGYSEYRLSTLQKNCSCARCRDEKTGAFCADPATLSEEVEAFRIESVGSYALRVLFTSGCSKGIYTFSFLRGLAC